MLGHEPGSLHGKGVEKILTIAARIFYQTHVFPLLKLKGRIDEIYLTLKAREGAEVPVLLNAARRERHGSIAYDCAIFPVRQRALYEDEILKAKAAAEEAARTRDEFLAVVSHELRTPLNAILGWARLMRMSEGDPETARQGLETIERNARAQARLIEDLLDVSRIVAGKLRIDVDDVDPSIVIEAALDVVRPAAEAKTIRLQQVLDREAGPVSGDPDRLQQVMWNLLSNAVKFTPKGGTVSVRLQRVNSHVEILVSDTGQGIAPEFLPYVFERFRQAEGAGSPRQGGLGLGMAITKEIVGLHGGTISVQSEGEGRGTTFIVNLPVLAVHRQGKQAETSAAPGRGELAAVVPTLDGCHVLLVDDAPDARDFLLAMLLRIGAQVTVAHDAPTAFHHLRELRPNVIVSDIEMPGEDGHSLIRRIRALSPEEGGATPAIALTANNRFADRMRALSAGFQIHITKPVEPDELAMVIANLRGQSGR
jgi:signal transduction histidine kinase/CheY-like chemotaxis protein